ncbi:PilX N-terminal domain-containing pilus assembly protein [Azomonas macrocytogenes]|uniref:Type IV pilus assembly protein PilX n=1 Tax=Azomonas macrocytogenes TaxID=69962 RepID=A0A839SXM2_AZOMA|nr:type IV pilus assembly protein PilX [Azomonas macrocytogenes]
MTGSRHFSARPLQQRGATLVVTLFMLLIITLLATTSMREVTLEARITGNLIEQKRLNNAAESALREGERRIAKLTSKGILPNLCVEDADGSTPCLFSDKLTADSYATNFEESFQYQGLDSSTTLERSARWYIREVPPSNQSSCTQNYLNNAPDESGNCPVFYEINAQAFQGNADYKECGPEALCLRSVIRVSN